MASNFQFQSTSPAKLGVQPLGDALTPATDLIQTWGSKGSRVPLSVLCTPGDQLLSGKTLFSSPQPTPSGCDREDALRSVEERLEGKLSAEIEQHATAQSKLGGESDVAQSARLEAEVSKRAERINTLQTKLNRTRFTLTELQASQQRLRMSSDKVDTLHAQLSREERSKARRAKRASLDGLRGELSEALAVMNAASRRVEQMEAITDMLVSQLAEKEAQLTAVQEAAQLSETAHAQQVHTLNREREGLIDEVASTRSQLVAMEARDSELANKFQEASRLAESLSAELESVERQRAAELERERAALQESMAQAQQAQHDLMTQLQDKEEALLTALEQAKASADGRGRVVVGTPIGEGAKKVLPMAFRRIKDTQELLAEQQAQRAGAESAAQRARQEKEEAVRQLEDRISTLDSERQRQVAEKHASLESMVRATAAATAEAARKAEALQTLSREQEALEALLAESEGQRAALSSALAQRDEETATLRAQVEALEALSTQAEVALGSLGAELAEANARAASDGAAAAAAASRLAVAELSVGEATRSASDALARLAGAESRADGLRDQLRSALSEQAALQSALGEVRGRVGAVEASAAAAAAAAAVALVAARAEASTAREEGQAAERELATLRATGAAAAERAADLETAAAGLEARCAELEGAQEAALARLAATEEELARARATGTPAGQGAKTVSKLAFERIRELQGEVEAARGQLDAQVSELDEVRAELEASRAELEASRAELEASRAELEVARAEAAEASQRAQRLQDHVQQAGETIAALEHRVQEGGAALGALGEDLRAAQAQALAQAATAAAAQAEARTLAARAGAAAESLEEERGRHAAQLEQSAAERTELRGRVEELAEARSQVAEERAAAKAHAAQLQSELEELRAAPVAGTPVGNASKQVVRLSFAKIRELQDREAGQTQQLTDLQTKLEEAEARVAVAEEALQAQQAELEAERRELAALAGAEARRAGLEAEVESLRDTVAHLGTVFHTADAALGAQAAAQEHTEKEWVELLGAARSDRDSAELARAAAERELEAALDRLAAKDAELEDARVAPTPKGEAAKRVVEQSLRRVEELQKEVAAYEAAEANAAARSSALAAELEGAKVTLAALTSQTEVNHGAMNEELSTLRARVAEESQNTAAVKTQLEALEAALAASRQEAASLAAVRAGPPAAAAEEAAPLQASFAAPLIVSLQFVVACLLGVLALLQKARIAELEAQLASQAQEGEQAQASAAQSRAQLAGLENAARTGAAAQAQAEAERLQDELSVAERQVEEQRALLTQVSEALMLQREATALTQRLGEQRLDELSKLLEAARKSGTEAALRAEDAERSKQRANRMQRQNAELATAFSQARSKVEALSVEINALKAEKTMVASQLAERARREEQAAQLPAVDKATSTRAVERAAQAQVEAAVQRKEEAEKAVAAARQAAEKLQERLATHARREGVLRLVATLACGALLVLGSAFAAVRGQRL